LALARVLGGLNDVRHQLPNLGIQPSDLIRRGALQGQARGLLD
jgi:hypothetical protein